MVYHEIRKTKGKTLNYLIHNSRANNKWKKTSKFIGYNKIPKDKIEKLKKEFESEIILKKKTSHLTKEQVQELENLKNTYNQKINSLEKEELEKFTESLFTELTYDSNAIEGSSLSLEETRLITQDNIAPKGKSLREIYEAKNHMKALEFLKNYQGNFDEKLILKLHSFILDNISQRFAGAYRQTNVKIFGSSVKFPDSQKVPQLIKNLIYWYKTNKKNYHPLELSAILSMKFVTIHPFIDGNGRISRLIMNFILQKNNYPKINILMKNRQEYLEHVRLANNENYTPIINFLKKTLKNNLKKYNII